MTDKATKETVARLKAYAECFRKKTGCTPIEECNEDLCDGCTLNYAQGTVGEHLKDIEMAIRALEQEPFKDKLKSISDKIKAEIKRLAPTPTAIDVVDGNPVKDAVWEMLIDVENIIDKYISLKPTTTDVATAYLLDYCDDCPENKDGECVTQSHCFEVKLMGKAGSEEKE